MDIKNLWQEIHARTSEDNILCESSSPHHQIVAFYIHTVVKYCKLHPSTKWLEYGCGSGKSLSYLLKIGLNSNLYAADISRLALGKAKSLLKKDGVKLHTRIIKNRKIDIPDETIDIINAEASIYYDDYCGLKASIGEIWRLLKPGGYTRIYTKSDYDRHAIDAFKISDFTYRINKPGHWEDGMEICCINKKVALNLMKKFSHVQIGSDSYEYTGIDGLKSFLIITARK